MSRLTAWTVFSALVTACRLAICPTSGSPLSRNPTTEGVVREPSALGITTGSKPSTVATQELVVPRSMPMVRATVEDQALPESVRFRRSEPVRRWPGGGRGRRHRHHHHRRAQQALADAVALLHLVQHRPGRGLGAGHLRDGVVQPGIEGLALGLQRLDVVALELALEQAQHQGHALLQGLDVGGALDGGRGPLEVVGHLQHVAQHGLPGLVLVFGLLAADPLLVVVELGRDPQHPVAQLDAFGLEGGHLGRRAPARESRFAARGRVPAAAPSARRGRSRPCPVALGFHSCPRSYFRTAGPTTPEIAGASYYQSFGRASVITSAVKSTNGMTLE